MQENTPSPTAVHRELPTKAATDKRGTTNLGDDAPVLPGKKTPDCHTVTSTRAPMLAQLQHIRELRGLGITLKEIGERFGVTQQRICQLLYNEKKTARDAVYHAVKAGRLVRPELCQKCDKPGDIQAHHHDYSKPLDVEWLCRSCHRQHPIPNTRVPMNRKTRERMASEHFEVSKSPGLIRISMKQLQAAAQL